MIAITIAGEEREVNLDDPELPDWVEDEAFGAGGYPYDEKLKKSVYNEELEALHGEMVKQQADRMETGKRVMIIFEGRDAAGKGGTIKAFREYLNPRHARIVALPKPTETEQGQWYYQRYVDHFPTSGEMVLFDRSWYNRGGVEPVMGFCMPQDHAKFLEQTPDFEKLIVDEGIALFKIWLNVGQEMQIKRFHARRHNHLKRWKLSSMDLKALAKWDDYTDARNQMLDATHTAHAPWTIVRSNDKRRARLNAVRHVLKNLDYEDKDDAAIGKIDPKILGHQPGFLNSFGA